jgi:hypothetical protein
MIRDRLSGLLTGTRITIARRIDEPDLMAKVFDPPKIADDAKYLPL